MSKALIEKLRKAREFGVAVNGNTYTVRRPTHADVINLPAANAIDFVHRFVVGWDLTEMQVVPGGGPDPVPFDPELWSAWVDDRPDVWEPIAKALLDAYRLHAEAREGELKN
jgi:hypothetical protein